MQNTSSIENGHGCMSQIEWRMHCNWMQNTFTVENGHGCISQSIGVCIAIGCRTPPRWRMVMAVCLKLSDVYIEIGCRTPFRWRMVMAVCLKLSGVDRKSTRLNSSHVSISYA